MPQVVAFGGTGERGRKARPQRRHERLGFLAPGEEAESQSIAVTSVLDTRDVIDAQVCISDTDRPVVPLQRRHRGAQIDHPALRTRGRRGVCLHLTGVMIPLHTPYPWYPLCQSCVRRRHPAARGSGRLDAHGTTVVTARSRKTTTSIPCRGLRPAFQQGERVGCGAVILFSRTGRSLHRPCRRMSAAGGNPAVVGMNPVDRKLCVPAFRRVCP